MGVLSGAEKHVPKKHMNQILMGPLVPSYGDQIERAHRKVLNFNSEETASNKP